MPHATKDCQYLTLLLSEGLSSLTVKEYLNQYGRVTAVSLSAERQIWRIEKDGLTVEDVDAIIEKLPLEWPLTNAFASNRKGEEV